MGSRSRRRVRVRDVTSEREHDVLGRWAEVDSVICSAGPTQDSLNAHHTSCWRCFQHCSHRGQRQERPVLLFRRDSMLIVAIQLPQQTSRPTYAPQQQRATYGVPSPLSTTSHTQQQQPLNPARPRNQLEAMPPFGPGQAPFMPSPAFYDSATRHPVFFTEQLRKPPFPMPEFASHGFSPVASGYIMESKRTDPSGVPRTKL